MNRLLKQTENRKGGYIFDNQTKIRQAILSGELLLPIKDPVNPYPDMTTYIPEDYYETPPKKALAVNAPGIIVVTKQYTLRKNWKGLGPSSHSVSP